MPLAQSGGASPRGLSVEVRDSLKNVETTHQASVLVTGVDSNDATLGLIKVSQGAAEQKIPLADKQHISGNKSSRNFTVGG